MLYLGDGLLSIGSIGEERYEPVDPLLFANDYDQTVWEWVPGSCVNTRYLTNPCPIPQYADVIAESGSITTYGHNAAESDMHSLRLSGLRLVDFRTTVRMKALGNTNYATAAIRTSKGIVYTESLGGNSVGAGKHEDVSSLEIRWDDYELGHYQIFRNQGAEPVQEGVVAEGEDFWIEMVPGITFSPNGDSQNVIVTFENPRIRRLFGDLEEGEVLTDACFGGPDVVEIEDLQGFKRFDLDAPSTFVTNVVEGNEIQSKRVMYALAQGEPVVVEANEAWKFQYITDGGTDEIGVSSKCDAPVLIEDLVDLAVEKPVIQDATVEWSSSGNWNGREYKSLKRDFKSGDQVFMTTSDVHIDEAICPYTLERQEYPGLPRECFTIDSYGLTFAEGTTHQVGTHLTVTLEDLDVRFQQKEDLGKMYVWSARWRLDFQEDAVLLQDVSAPGVVGLGENAVVSMQALNRLPTGGHFQFTGTTRHEIVDDTQLTTEEGSIDPAGTTPVTFAMSTEFLGENTIFIFPTMQTEAGGVSFRAIEVAYTVERDAPETATSASVSQVEKGFFQRLWDWVVRLFGG